MKLAETGPEVETASTRAGHEAWCSVLRPFGLASGCAVLVGQSQPNRPPRDRRAIPLVTQDREQWRAQRVLQQHAPRLAGRPRALVLRPSHPLRRPRYRFRLYRTEAGGVRYDGKRVLTADGRLVFSYANREPAAWINLFAALKASGFHPIAYTILQSENELDPWRKKGRACSLDLLLELSPAPVTPSAQHRTKAQLGSIEEDYLLEVGETFLATVDPPADWEETFVSKLKVHPFLAPSAARSSVAVRIAAE